MNNHWWENVYNQAATNLNVATNESNDVKVGLNSEQSIEVNIMRAELFCGFSFEMEIE